LFTLSFKLDQESKIKLYYQLYTNIAHGIESGDIPEGTKIFSVRDMARELDVSRNTVTKAYSELIEAGYLVSKNKSGYYATLPKNLEKPVTEAKNSETYSKEDVSQTVESNLIESYKFALTINSHLLKSSGDPFGDSNFRYSIAKFLKSYRDINVLPSQMVVSAGIDLLLQNLLHLSAITKPYTKSTGHGLLAAATELNSLDPASVMISKNIKPHIKRIIEESGLDYTIADYGEWGINVDKLYESKTTLLFVTPDDVLLKNEKQIKQNRRDILEWSSEQSNRYIIELDTLSYNDGRKSFKSEDTADKVIYIGSMSNLLFKAINASWMVLPQFIDQDYRKRYVEYECVLSRLDQLALTDFINGGNLAKYLDSIEVI